MVIGGGGRKGREAAIRRYETLRSFVLRTLYTWLTLTILLTFSWPMLVVFAGAPGVSPANTPDDWFQIRLLITALVAAVVVWLWRLSPIPTDVAQPRRALDLLRRGKVWPQVIVFLGGLVLILSIVLLAEDPDKRFKVISLGLAEALAVQMLLSGFMHGFFELVIDEAWASFATLGLFALTFAIRAGLASATRSDLGEQLFIVALAAGAVLGAIVGGVSLLLCRRSGSLLPGILAQWLVLAILPAFFE